MSRNYDNWERLVAAVLDREKLREIARAPSLSSSFSSITSDACLYALEDVPALGDHIDQGKMSATKVQLVRCPNCRRVLAELPDITLYQCGGCGIILKAKTRKLDTNNAGLSSQEKDSNASRFPSKTSHASVPSSINVLSYSAKSLPTQRSKNEILSFPHVKAFSFNELKKATGNFRPDSIIGEGEFGVVFKGWIDEHTLSAAKPGSGLVIAVKKLNPESFQGYKEWLTEVNYLGQLHHPNLVKLIGYCSKGDNKLLVYEFMSKGNLENHLFRGPQPLSWDKRIKVAIDAARGLSFLHEAEEQVIHRDFKASNILLDGVFNAKLGPTGNKGHVSTQIMGTHGYAAPEYIVTGQLTAKYDVYSFGVVMLELLSGRRAFDRTKVGVDRNLVEWAKPYMNDNRKLFRIMDIKLEGQYPQKAALTAATIALQCLSPEPKLRPRMAEVLATLEELHLKTENKVDTVSMSPMKHHFPMNMMLLQSLLPAHRRASRAR